MIQSGAKGRPAVMVSSTSLDLPEHRQRVLDACIRQFMFPQMMEHLPASNSDALTASYQLVDTSDIYIGVIGRRYGFVPSGQDMSITEMEYNRAASRSHITKLIFIMSDKHPATQEDEDQEPAASKLRKFKQRLTNEQVVNYFESPDDLKALVINSLSHLRLRSPQVSSSDDEFMAPKPEPFLAHRYTLLQTRGLIGRKHELDHLTRWISDPQSRHSDVRVMNIVAMGGTGKSALTWHWILNVAAKSVPLAGRLWWSFHDEDADFDSFQIAALAYITGRKRREVSEISRKERERQILAHLDHERYLFVLDGIEQLFICDQTTADDDSFRDSDGVDYRAVPGDAADARKDWRRRRFADERHGAFLKQLATIGASRILISTRHYPADLQSPAGTPLAGCDLISLKGLADDDALELWRNQGVTGSRDALLRLFRSFDKHPLLIQTLAGQIAQDRRARGDFDKWQATHRDFDPFRLPIVQVMSHVLNHSVRDLDSVSRQVLHTLAGFRMAVAYETLAYMLVGIGKPIDDEAALDRAMTDLEERGLLGWDRGANRYDMHPIVRGVTWSRLGPDRQREVRQTIYLQFKSLPQLNWRDVESMEILADSVEHYFNLVEMGDFDQALEVFGDHLNDATLYRLSSNYRRIEMLELLFPDGVDQLPRLRDLSNQAFAINALAQSYYFSGQLTKSVPLFQRHVVLQEELNHRTNLAIGLRNLSDALLQSGKLYEAEQAARRALALSRQLGKQNQEAESLCTLGFVWAVRGQYKDAQATLDRARKLDETNQNMQGAGVACAFEVQRALWHSNDAASPTMADRVCQLALVEPVRRDGVRAKRLQGLAALACGELPAAHDPLHDGLCEARNGELVEEELFSLCALAELRRCDQRLDEAADVLKQLWPLATEGGYALALCLANNVAAKIALDRGNSDAAKESATKAFHYGWCNGSPFSFEAGTKAARDLLRQLECPPPSLVDFDATRHEPSVDIDSS